MAFILTSDITLVNVLHGSRGDGARQNHSIRAQSGSHFIRDHHRRSPFCAPSVASGTHAVGSCHQEDARHLQSSRFCYPPCLYSNSREKGGECLIAPSLTPITSSY